MLVWSKTEQLWFWEEGNSCLRINNGGFIGQEVVIWKLEARTYSKQMFKAHFISQHKYERGLTVAKDENWATERRWCDVWTTRGACDDRQRNWRGNTWWNGGFERERERKASGRRLVKRRKTSTIDWFLNDFSMNSKRKELVVSIGGGWCGVLNDKE